MASYSTFGSGSFRIDEAAEGNEESSIMTPWEASGQSRVTKEFKILEELGKGAYGDVLKLKNRLDGQLYAVKRIKLNPKIRAEYKKIKREVKLLSRLNHVNVVRYYNSWIETSDEPAQNDPSSSGLSESSKVTDPSKHRLAHELPREDTLDWPDDMEQLVSQCDGVFEDSISYEPSGSHVDTELEEEEDEDLNESLYNDDDDDDDENVDDSCGGEDYDGDHGDGSDGVVFNEWKEKSDNENETYDQLDTLSDKGDGSSDVVPKLQYLYIQMEYCEKSTLRSCIDEGLYQDHTKVWRLFREIIEGLVHIHGQGIIHRDLKPVNIFLDVNDHVKIGDFGLATTDIIAKKEMPDDYVPIGIDVSSSMSGSYGNGSMTGMVGTSLYISPEMLQSEKIISNHEVLKVDIYSLGIIFFEMCYKPMSTEMERVQVLSKLRTEDKIFPDDFDHVQLENQCKIIRWLLNHDPSQRPTAQELLQSEYLPPPQMEEAELNDILRSTISDPHSKPYRRMINALFSQSISLADDHLYDSDIYKGTFSIKTNLANRKVLERLEQIFQRHGALKVNTSILMPKPAFYKNTEQYVCMMDDSGQLLGLPHDLRVPFARYVARNNIHQLKRYCIERVFKKTNSGFHPSELTECAFDIITKTRRGLIPDGEVLALVGEVIKDFLPLQKRQYYVQINHTSLLKAVLLHVGVNEDQHLAVLGSLTNLKNLMSECSLNDQNVTDLEHLLETEVSLSKVSSVLKCITRTKGQAGRLVKHALSQIKTVISNARYLGLKLPVKISMGLVDNIQQYSGVYYQVAVDEKEKNVFAIGGRYDSLISAFYSPLFSSGIPVKTHCGVGVSFAFEHIVNAMLEEDNLPTPSLCDILVCTIGRKSLRKVGMKLLKALWNADFRAELFLEASKNPGKIFDFCRTHGISYLVLLKESELIVKTIEKETVIEELIQQNEKGRILEKNLVDFFKQKLACSKQDSIDTSHTWVSRENTTSTQPRVDYTHSISSSSSVGDLTINFYFFMRKGKISADLRKKRESQIVSEINHSLPWLSKEDVTIEVIAMQMGFRNITVIATSLHLDGDQDNFKSSVRNIYVSNPRCRKYLRRITGHIYKLKFEKRCDYIALYSIKDRKVKLLMEDTDA